MTNTIRNPRASRIDRTRTVTAKQATLALRAARALRSATKAGR